MNVKLQLQNKIEKTVKGLWSRVTDEQLVFEMNYPPDPKFGDYTCNVALKLAPALRLPPMEIALKIMQTIGPITGIKRVETAPPGFLNFFMDEQWLVKSIRTIVMEKKKFGSSNFGRNKRVILEFISANPTGPLTLANGRGGYVGDVLANVLKLGGFRTWREYYVNDRGNQINILAESVLRRYWQQHGITIDFPDYCYQGEYIDELAQSLYLPNYKLGSVAKLETIRDKIKGRILTKMLKLIQRVIEQRMGIHFDKYFSEKSLYERGDTERVLAMLRQRDLVFEQDGALWMRTSRFGDDKDRVLIKSDGEATYILSDIALGYDRFVRRKFDKYILLLGADHHGYVARMHASMNTLGWPDRLQILIIQMVRLFQGGQEVRMSKRKGTYIPIDDLIDEVGSDAARFIFLMYDNNTHMNFDLDLAKKQSKDNSVYYVQYAHARICSIMKKTRRLRADRKRLPLEPAESALLKELLRWPELVHEIAVSYQVHKLPFYAISVATRFHDFYTRCRVINSTTVIEQRLQIVQATQQVLQNVLAALGVRAPEKM